MTAVYVLPPRYDIKGCNISRWVDPAPEGSPLVLVLKDLNFQEKTMRLGELHAHCLVLLQGEVWKKGPLYPNSSQPRTQILAPDLCNWGVQDRL